MFFFQTFSASILKNPDVIFKLNCLFLIFFLNAFVERLNQIQISRDLNFQTRQKPLGSDKYPKYDEVRDYDDEEEDQQQEDYEDEEKVSYTSSTTPHSRCSRGVSTDELDEAQAQAQAQAQKNPSIINNNENNNSSRRFEDGRGVVDRVIVSQSAEAAPSRNSVLLQLIACGSSAVAKAKSSPCVKPAGPAMKRGIGNNSSGMRSRSDIGRGVLWKNAVKMVVDEDQDHDMINYISENPRFGNLQAQEKEYFSGSIVESMSDNPVSAISVLKRSNSYNEER